MIDLFAYLQYRLTQSITRYKRCVDCRSDSRSPRACAAVEFKRGVTARRREHGKKDSFQQREPQELLETAYGS